MNGLGLKNNRKIKELLAYFFNICYKFNSEYLQ